MHNAWWGFFCSIVFSPTFNPNSQFIFASYNQSFQMKNLFALLLFSLCLNIAIAQERPEIIPGNIIVQVPDESVSEVILANQFFDGQPTDLKLDRLLSAPMAAYLLEFNPNIHHNRFLKQLWDHPAVSMIQFNHVIQERIVPNDPQFGQQWWHMNGGGGGGLTDADIDSDEAWEITTGGVTALGDTIVVCVIDDGGDLDHPDLMANNWVNYHEIPNNNIDDDNNGYVDDYLGWDAANGDDNIDGGSHGVNVAGMIGAVGNNNTGVVGVNWNVKIMNMKYGSIGSAGNPNEANVIEAYTYPLIMRRQYEATNGALGAFVVATNSSWGLDNADPLDAPLWCAFYDTLGAAGILSAGATANNNVDIDVVGDLPTACASEYMISVTATNNSDVRTFSAYGSTTVDLGAPGEDARTTASGGNYTTTSGTSFASPATAGAVALMYSAPCASLAAISHSDPALAAQMVRDAIFNGVDPVSNLSGECVTGGRLNIKGALDEILNNCSSGGCMAPFSLAATGITDTETDITFGHLAGIDTFNFEYGVVGMSGTIINNVLSSPFNLNGLTACMDYWIIGQSVCDGAESDWSDTLFFSTDGCCEPPSSLTLSGIGNSTVTATWPSVLAATSYIVQWRVVGAGSWSEMDNITAVTYEITGLDDCTEYEVRVATNCGGGTTDYTSVQIFTTFGCGSCTDETFCESTGDNDLEWIGNVTVDQLDNTTADNTGGYGDYTTMSVDLTRGQTYNVSFSPDFSGSSFTEHFRVWIDLNQNGTFSNAEMLFDDTQGSQNTVTGTIDIPLTAALGSARMRVSMAYGSQFGGGYPQDDCGDIGFGEVEDYCVNILVELPDGIEETQGNFGMAVFPVPASEILNIRLLNAEIDAAQIFIMDAAGRTVSVQNIEATSVQQLDVSQFSDGVYLIEVRDFFGQTVARSRFVKQ